MSPTQSNFDQFVHTLDKLLSENINRDFFVGKIEPTRVITRKDGSNSTETKGSLTLLEEWLNVWVVGKDAGLIVDQVINPMKSIRKARQSPAHKIGNNQFSDDFYERRRNILLSLLESLTCLRAVFGKHRLAKDIEVPDWLNSNSIEVF